MPFYVLFIIFPLLELWFFVEMAGEIGFFSAAGLLILAAIIGTALIQRQGFQTLLAMHDAMERGKVPLSEMFEGFCIVGAGILLIMPGFLTDLLAIALLIPQARTLFRGFIRRHPKWHDGSGVIEGEYEHIADEVKTLPERKQP